MEGMGGRLGMGRTTNVYGFSLSQDVENILKVDCGNGLQPLSILKTTELYIFRGQILTCISIKLLKKKKANIFLREYAT